MQSGHLNQWFSIRLDLKKTFVCNQVQDSGKKQLNKQERVTGSRLRSESSVYLSLRSVFAALYIEANQRHIC